MEILAYGEDALTLWALKNNVSAILQALNDSSDPSQCRTFFRPSFGRSGGEHSSQFGEFDFILLASHCIYLGESKWDKSSEKIVDGALSLRDEQLLRHKMFRFYIEEWAFGRYGHWEEFAAKSALDLRQQGITKPIAPDGSLLAANLQTVLGVIEEYYSALPPVKNLLLYFHSGMNTNQLPRMAGEDFVVVPLDYSEDLFGNYIKL